MNIVSFNIVLFLYKLAEVDALKSSLVVPSSLLLMEQWKETKLTFDERDKFGNVVISGVENLLKYSFVFFEVSFKTVDLFVLFEYYQR